MHKHLFYGISKVIRSIPYPKKLKFLFSVFKVAPLYIKSDEFKYNTLYRFNTIKDMEDVGVDTNLNTTLCIGSIHALDLIREGKEEFKYNTLYRFN